MSDRYATRTVLGVLAGVVDRRCESCGGGPTEAAGSADETDPAVEAGASGGDPAVEVGASDSDAIVEAGASGGDPAVEAGGAAVARGDTAELVAAAERANGDVHRAAAFASAGGFAHLAGVVAATDDPVLAARGALVLVRVAAWRADGDGATPASTDAASGRRMRGVTGEPSVPTDAGRSDDGTGMSVDPVRTDE